jgi:hypothetical protein
MPEPLDVDADGHAVLHQPASGHHHAVGAIGAAQDQGRKRIACPGEAQLVKRVESQIGLPAD